VVGANPLSVFIARLPRNCSTVSELQIKSKNTCHPCGRYASFASLYNRAYRLAVKRQDRYLICLAEERRRKRRDGALSKAQYSGNPLNI